MKSKMSNLKTNLKQINLSIANEQILTNMLNGFILADTKGQLIKVNPAYCNMIGYTEAELLKMNIYELDVTIYPKQMKNQIDEIISLGSVRFETKHKHKDGHLIDLAVNIIITQSNKTPLVAAFVNDITRFKQTETTIKRFSRLIEESLNEIYICDAETYKFIEVNQAALKNIGYTLEEIKTLTPLDIKPEFNINSFNELVKPLRLNKTKKIVFKTYHKRKNSTLYPVEAYYQLIDFEGINAFAAIILDITEKQKVEDALHNSYKNYSALINGMNETVWVIGFNGKFIDVNHAAVEKLGYTREELLSMGPSDIDVNLDTGIIKNLIDDIKSDKVQIFETKHIAKDGGIIPVEVQSTLVKYQQKDAILSIARDITDRKWIEKTLYTTQKHYTDFLNASSDAVSYWKMPDGLRTDLPVQRQIEMIYKAVCFDANKACWESFGFDTKDKLIGMKYYEFLTGKKSDEKFKKFILNGYHIDNLENHEIQTNGILYDSLENLYGVIENGDLTYLWYSIKDITDLKQAEKKLEEERHLFDIFMNNTLDNIYFKDKDSRFIQVNKHLANYLNVELPEELIGKSDFDFFDEKHAKMALRDEKKIIKTGVPILDKTEKEIFKDGSIGWVSTSKLPFKDAYGNTIGTFGISRDITDRIKSEEEIRRLSKIVEQAEAPVFLTNLNGTIEYINPAFERVTGFSKKEAIGQNPDILNSGLMPVDYFKRIWQKILKGEQITEVVINKKKNGETWYYDQTIVPLKDDKGKVVQFVSTGKDITDRIIAEQALKESEKRLSLAIKAAKLGIWDWDVRKKTLIWDNTMFQLYGITGKDFDGTYKAWTQRIHPDDLKKIDVEFQTTLGGEKEFAEEFRIVWPDGTIRYIQGLGVLHLSDEGKPDRLIGVNWDITKQKQAEDSSRKFSEELEKRVQERTIDLEKARTAALSLMQDADIQRERAENALKELAESQERLKIAKDTAVAATIAKSNFLASMSHELRTPLNSIIGFSQVLREQYFGKLNKKQAEYVLDIMESGEHLLDLINDILDLSKVEAGKMELELDSVHIHRLLNNSLSMIKEKCIKNEIQLSLKTTSKLKNLTIRVDQRKIKQVMFNLLSNAAKFTPSGGSISVFGNITNSMVEISVTDTGIGIEGDMIEKIFEEFFQVSSKISEKTPGTGLGLPLSRKMINMHGGHLWAESEGEGKGSKFIFTIPIGEENNNE